MTGQIGGARLHGRGHRHEQRAARRHRDRHGALLLLIRTKALCGRRRGRGRGGRRRGRRLHAVLGAVQALRARWCGQSEEALARLLERLRRRIESANPFGWERAVLDAAVLSARARAAHLARGGGGRRLRDAPHGSGCRESRMERRLHELRIGAAPVRAERARLLQ